MTSYTGRDMSLEERWVQIRLEAWLYVRVFLCWFLLCTVRALRWNCRASFQGVVEYVKEIKNFRVLNRNTPQFVLCNRWRKPWSKIVFIAVYWL